MTHLVHKNENNNDIQHKIDGESLLKPVLSNGWPLATVACSRP
jgi:hypothetical protein